MFFFAGSSYVSCFSVRCCRAAALWGFAGVAWLFNTTTGFGSLSLISTSTCHSLGVGRVEAFAKVFLVEPHRGGDTSRCPIDHHISQQVVQRELPETQTTFNEAAFL